MFFFRTYLSKQIFYVMSCFPFRLNGFSTFIDNANICTSYSFILFYVPVRYELRDIGNSILLADIQITLSVPMMEMVVDVE